MFEIKHIQQEEQIVVSVRKRLTVEQLPIFIGESFGKLAAYIGQLGADVTGTPFTCFYGLDEHCHLDESNMDVEIGFPVAGPVPKSGDIGCRILPSGEAVSSTYTGCYADMTPLYKEMADWIRRNGYRSQGCCFEYYFTGPEIPEAEHITNVVIPVSKVVL